MTGAINMTKADRPLPPRDIVKAALEIWSETDRQQIISITGRSMLPLIQTGDQVLVAHGRKNARRGDVIVFLQDEKMVAHRVLYVNPNSAEAAFIAKGDNNASLDPPVSAGRYVGRVLRIKRGERWLSIDTPAWRVTGWLIAVGMIAWLKMFGAGRRLKRNLWGEQSNALSRALVSGFKIISRLPLQLLRKITDR